MRRVVAVAVAVAVMLAVGAAGCGDNTFRPPPELPPPGCGDGVLDPGEGCDDGNAKSGDGCDFTCTLTGCGNGIATAGEACDDGNAVSGDGCDANCTLTGCGNGAVAPGEACDDGNDIDGDGCDANCTLTGCGNGIATAGEACDDGNAIDTDDCTASCEAVRCGDGIAAVDAIGPAREACDGAPPGSDAPVETATCNLDCTAAVCGDAKYNPAAGEACDDGNAIDTDNCTTACAAAVCGDGIAAVDATSPEPCDDGNTNTEPCAYGAASCTVCSAGCTLDAGETRTCGDGLAQAPFEVCDDGNATDGDWCNTGCQAVGLSAPTYVKASNTKRYHYFGYSLALSADGSTMVVGTPFEDSFASGINGDQTNNFEDINTGAVYVYVRSGDTWVQQAYIKASNAGYEDWFGASVALSADGSTLAVGAAREWSAATGVNGDQASNGARYSGAVYVFVRSGAAWSQQAYVKASNTGMDDEFGSSVTLSADGATLAVGAPYEDSAATGVGGNQADNGATNAGAVYVFSRSGAAWSQQAYVKASNTDAEDWFSTVRLSADGATLAVGASGEDGGAGGDPGDDSMPSAGAVYVFARSGSTWSQEAYVKARVPDSGDGFARSSLSGDGSLLAVGAPGAGASYGGAVFLFARAAGAWSQVHHLEGPDLGDSFGGSVALSADGAVLAVSAVGEDGAGRATSGDPTDNSSSEAGAVFRFTRQGERWTRQAYLKASNTYASLTFGTRVALSADGSTIAASAIRDDSAATGIDGDAQNRSAQHAGAVHVFE